MAGFRSLARQVRDPGHDMALRRYSLRKCLERFAPYGHRATWDHLCRRHRFGPEDRELDPGRLVAALDELEEARAVWLAYEEEFAARRRREKHEGLRRLGALDDWHRRVWGGNGVVRCGDPAVHPSDPLPDVLRRLITALESGPGEECPVCAGPRIEWADPGDAYAPSSDPGDAYAPSSGPVCADCGVGVPRAVLTSGALARARTDRHRPLASAA